MTSEVESKLVSRRKTLPFLVNSGCSGPRPSIHSRRGANLGRGERREHRVEKRYERRGGTPAAKQPTQGQPAQGQATQGQSAGQKQ